MGDLLKHIQKTEERESVLHKVSGYDANCSTGFRVPKFCQIHHIVCVSSVAQRAAGYPDGMFDYIEACLWVTPWDINDGHNLVGLPLNKQYRTSDGQTPENTPSHQIDHNTRDGYTNEVTQYLAENVWNSLSAKKKVHEVDVQKLTSLLRGASDEFRGKLVSRGGRKDGTRVCWEHRFDDAYRTKWYYPFSMGKTPSRRHPGVSFKRLTKIFKKLEK